tara:strand:+ start:499 stop:690 length:192 start_codon:yes stop_codon:yes gene_type:complete
MAEKKEEKKKELKKELEKFEKSLKTALKSFENLSDFDDENSALIIKVFLCATNNKVKSHLENL